MPKNNGYSATPSLKGREVYKGMANQILSLLLRRNSYFLPRIGFSGHITILFVKDAFLNSVTFIDAQSNIARLFLERPLQILRHVYYFGHPTP